MIFFCVCVMYSGEYDICDVTLSVYPHTANLRNMPDHGGKRTYNRALAEHWASIPKVVGSITTVVKHIFQACPVWIYTPSNITSIIFTSVHYTNTEKIMIIPDCLDIEGTRFCSEISHTRADLTGSSVGRALG